jgi:hypothetical protein
MGIASKILFVFTGDKSLVDVGVHRGEEKRKCKETKVKIYEIMLN